MLSVRMRLVLLMFYIGLAEIRAASIKKSIKETALKPEIPTKAPKLTPTTIPPPPIPAIVAIEIIKEPDNNISSAPKNTTKRTVESSVGYGYQNFHGQEPQKKFMIYKYSQQDIPPITYNQLGGYNPHAEATVQKGIGYHLGSTVTQIPHQSSPHLAYQAQEVPAMQYYNPSNTLYTTLSHQGQLGGLSNDIPYQHLGQTGMVPVIILRVYANQLSSPETALHTNLPQTHPYSGLNNVNLQSLLQTYVQQYLHSQQSAQHYQPQAQDYQQLYQGHQQAYHQVPDEYHSNLPTSENYPSKHHTRVIFHSNNNGHIPEPKAMFKTAGLSTYKTVSVPSYQAAHQPSYTEVQTPDSQYAYSSEMQNLEPGYMYVYPNQLEQEIYYQDAQNYQLADGQGVKAAEEPPSVAQGTSEVPYNYHAHGPSPKQRRSKKNTGVVPTTTEKRREPRDTMT